MENTVSIWKTEVAIWKILFLKRIKIKLQSDVLSNNKIILPASCFISIPRIFLNRKCLYIRQETSILNRNNFRLLATAATTVAQFEQQSFVFYRGGHQDSVSGALDLVISRYLAMRVNMALHAVPLSTFSRTTKEERTRIYEVIRGREGAQPPVVKPTTTVLLQVP
jgi:hypothetical protein